MTAVYIVPGNHVLSLVEVVSFEFRHELKGELSFVFWLKHGLMVFWGHAMCRFCKTH